MSLVGALRSAVSAMQVAQASFQVASANIANVNTEGYSRKTVSQEPLVVAGRTAGVRLTDIERQVDLALQQQVRDQGTVVGALAVRDDYLQRIQNLFGTLADNATLSHTISDLGAAWEALGTSPDSIAARLNVVDAAERLVSQFNSTTVELQRMRRDADQEITRVVERINAILTDIDKLNDQIALGTAQNRPIGDLEDQRDKLLAELAREIDIRTMKRSSGEIVVYTTSGRALLDTSVTPLSHTAASQLDAAITLGNGINGIILGTGGPDITTEIAGGRLAGLIELRDTVALDLQAEIDTLAETLRDQLNAAHNNGTTYPPPLSVTGARIVAGTDQPTMTGTFRVSVLSSTGVVVETLDIDLGALAPPTIGQLVATINGMTNASAGITNGQVTISTTGTNGIAVNDMTSAVTTGAATMGMAQFLGLNNLLDTADDYDVYVSGRTPSDTAALGIAGTLTFQHGATSTNVAYAVGDSLTDIATAITAALAAENVTATVVSESGGYRLVIEDTDADNFFVTDSGNLVSQLNVRANQVDASGRLQVASALTADPSLLARGALSSAGGLAAGDIGLSIGDATVANQMAALFTSNINFAAAGQLSQVSVRLADYAGEVMSNTATMASSAERSLATSESYHQALANQAASISGVNLDEEMANLIVLQNAYAAAARVTTTAAEMLDLLISTGR